MLTEMVLSYAMLGCIRIDHMEGLAFAQDVVGFWASAYTQAMAAS